MSDLLIVKDKVQRFARELFDDIRLDEDGDIAIPFEDTVVWVRVWEREITSPEMEKFFVENQLSHSIVRVWSVVLTDLKPSLELFKWVAVESQDNIFGHYLLEPSDDTHSSFALAFNFQISGSTLDAGELKDALLAVMSCSDNVIADLQKRFGGRTLFEGSK